MMGTSTLLAEARSEWRGTLVILFQPDEEHGAGARAMLDDGLYEKVPKPDIVLGQHLTNVKAGVLTIRPGSLMAAADTLKVTVFGRGAHGAAPQESIDPIVLAAHMIVRLQTVVAREIGPLDVATVTCAYIHGGKSHNVIPADVEFMLNIRTFDTGVRETVLAAVKRIIRGEAIASGVLKEPEIVSILSYPLTENDPEATEKLESTFKGYFGKDRTWEANRSTASEDISWLARDIGVPCVFWDFGGVDHGTWAEFESTNDRTLISSPHQANYAPVIQPTLRTGIEAMSLAALTFLKVES
jgi:amidohydrolase